MLNRSTLSRSASALTLIGLVLSTAACAGPRVGDVVGAPSTTSMTVQAKVVSATPVIGQVAVPRQVCYDELRQNPPRSSGAGAVMGAIAGGVIGNSVGKGAGKALATGLGIFGGAIAGDHIENDGRQGTTSSVRRCEQQAEYENRVMAYNVVYEFAGQRFSTQMSQEPGATIPVQVTLSPVVAQAPVIAPAVYTPSPEPVYVEPYEPGWRRHRHWD
ncbi:MAG TPA: hypothetical protein VFW93_18820 [Aquabacterium sp.]|uniref:glycine zipper 2TM domain-containing protein n=1 Tax=Aquabacterium sp. TaxID=1872578 RepID=UPI002E333A96|nr:hypothetical protein [Aquabacterium sp.]HEX5358262.1 hypothetical protein [Aquabacterium sp.]